MIELEFPDGSRRSFAEGTTGAEVAAGISKSLEKKAVLVRLDGKLLDLKRPLTGGGKFEILTRESPDVLDTIRHDASHVLAEAVQELFPGTQVTIGPAIDDGFYYDFARAEPFQLEDLEKIEKRMREIVDRDEPIRREVWDRQDAIAHFLSIGETYKAEIIQDLPGSEEISVYFQGAWKDLCLGPHLPSTRHVGKAFKLTKLAGAYWRGDQKNAQLQRIYGTAWASEADLEAYLTRIEEAEKRDHRRIGRQMDLFHLQEEAVGAVFWHAKGTTLWRTLENYIRRVIGARGYEEVRTPMLMDRSLWETSGHWAKFHASMFVCEVADEGRMLAVKPMNCPGHVQIFNTGQKSYRDLPLRMAEFGSCHRYEPSGALHGIMRVRAFVQDDAHIFCTPEQLMQEAIDASLLIFQTYKHFGFERVEVKLSTRPENRIGSDETWDEAESMLAKACELMEVPYKVNEGEGAFYGPKLEFTLYDAIGRAWQCGTVQIDFNLPERFEAEYVADDGSKKRPAMLHRAVLGSLERFIGILIEHFGGAFPLWLAPVQVVVATITSDADDYARDAARRLTAAGLRVELDLRNEKINYKIREHSLAKVPVIAVVGRNEAETRQVALRRLGSQGQQILGLDAAAAALTEEALPPDLRPAPLHVEAPVAEAQPVEAL
jgi:threonyl-tRNA synthetase